MSTTTLTLTADEHACVCILPDIFLVTSLGNKEFDLIASELARLPVSIDEIGIMYWDKVIRVALFVFKPPIPRRERLAWTESVWYDWEEVKRRFVSRISPDTSC
jgi:hypothetical protein